MEMIKQKFSQIYKFAGSVEDSWERRKRLV
jgi:hypothetical protein